MRVSVSVAMYSACRSGTGACGARVPVAQQPRDRRRMRKFRRAAEAAPVARRSCARSCGARSRAAAHRPAPAAAAGGGFRSASAATTAAAGCAQLRHVRRGSTLPRCAAGRGRRAGRGAASRRKIGAAEERPLIVVHQEHRQRPAAAAAGQHLVRELVDAVEVGAFLAVDLDVDEQLVHQRGSGGILEGLVRHHVAPVAGGVADRQQDRAAARAARASSASSPHGMPVHRVVRVLAQVGARGPARADSAVPGWSLYSSPRCFPWSDFQ